MNLFFLHPSLSLNRVTHGLRRARRHFLGMFNLNDSQWGRGGGSAPPDQPAAGHQPSAGQPAPAPPSAPQPAPPSAPQAPQTPQSPQSPQNPAPGQRQSGGGQPPDLDEIWRDVNEKIGRLFGQKPRQTPQTPNGSNSQPPNGGDNRYQPPPLMAPRSAGFGLAAIVGVAVLLWLATGFYVVQEGQQAVVMRFGKYKGDQSGGLANAGVNWRLPYPFESHEVVQFTQLTSVEVGRNKALQGSGGASSLRDSSMLTQDENIVDVRFVVQYRLKNSADYVFNNDDPKNAVILAAESAVREVVGKGTMNTVLNEKREAIAGDIVKSIQSQLDAYKTGIVISSVNIQNVQPPEQVQAAFDDALKAGQDGDRAKNEGQAYANDVIPRAEGAAARLREEAEGYKAKVVAQAEGDASRFKAILPEYQRAPQVMRDRLYTDTMQQIYSSVTKVLVDSKQGSQLLYLPLDKLLQATAADIVVSPATTPGLNAAPSAAPSPAGSSGPAAIPGNNPRGRERESR